MDFNEPVSNSISHRSLFSEDHVSLWHVNFYIELHLKRTWISIKREANDNIWLMKMIQQIDRYYRQNRREIESVERTQNVLKRLKGM